MIYIAFDFDGTVCENAFPEIGEIGEEQRLVIEYLRARKEAGDRIILWTCREDLPERAYLTEAVEWCRKKKIPVDYVNENPEFTFGYPEKVRKIFAHVYIDDRSVNPLSPEGKEFLQGGVRSWKRI